MSKQAALHFTPANAPTKAEVISALHHDFAGNYAAAARYAEQVALQDGRDADTYRAAAEWFKQAAGVSSCT